MNSATSAPPAPFVFPFTDSRSASMRSNAKKMSSSLSFLDTFWKIRVRSILWIPAYLIRGWSFMNFSKSDRCKPSLPEDRARKKFLNSIMLSAISECSGIGDG